MSKGEDKVINYFYGRIGWETYCTENRAIFEQFLPKLIFVLHFSYMTQNRFQSSSIYTKFVEVIVNFMTLQSYEDKVKDTK